MDGSGRERSRVRAAARPAGWQESPRRCCLRRYRSLSRFWPLDQLFLPWFVNNLMPANRAPGPFIGLARSAIINRCAQELSLARAAGACRLNLIIVVQGRYWRGELGVRTIH